MENHQNMESDIDIDLQVTLYTLCQAISTAFNIPYQRSKELLNKAIHSKDINLIEIVTQLYHIEEN